MNVNGFNDTEHKNFEDKLDSAAKFFQAERYVSRKAVGNDK